MENMELIQVKIETDEGTNIVKNEDVHSEEVFVKEELVLNSDSDSNSSELVHKELSDNEDRPFGCSYKGCKKYFKNKKSLWNHTQAHLNKRVFKCTDTDCSKSFRTSHKLAVHMVIHSNLRRFKCTYEGCLKVFRHNHHLMHHMKLHNDERPFVCTSDACGKSFKTKRDLTAHLRIHSDARPFICEYGGCSKSFKTKETFKCHLLVHTDDKPFHCTHNGCSKAFNLKSKMLYHLKTHSINKNFKCEVDGCQKVYKQEKHLSSHVISAHLPKPDPVIEPVHCTYNGCDSVLNTKRSLYDHMRRHRMRQAGVKYNCKFGNCSKEYTSETGLRKHLKTHGGPLTFIYDNCETMIDSRNDQNLTESVDIESMESCDNNQRSRSSFDGVIKNEQIDPGIDIINYVSANSEILEDNSSHCDYSIKSEDPLLGCGIKQEDLP